MISLSVDDGYIMIFHVESLVTVVFFLQHITSCSFYNILRRVLFTIYYVVFFLQYITSCSFYNILRRVLFIISFLVNVSMV